MAKLRIYQVAYVETGCGSSSQGWATPHERYEVATSPKKAGKKAKDKLLSALGRQTNYSAFEAKLIRIPGFRITVVPLEQMATSESN